MIENLLLATARASLENATRSGPPMIVPDEALASFPHQARKKSAAYVSIWRWPQMDPRASHGFHQPDEPLINAVAKAARGCALHETVFPRLKPEELSNIIIRVHLIGERKPLETTGGAIPEGNALFLEYKAHSAVFLHEVAELAGWDIQEAASQLCLKAGLPGDMWLSTDVKLMLAPVRIIEEEAPGRNPLIGEAGNG
ncbi:MAG: AMMECR1 domain-containing protein [Nitrospinae bacterium]|nr:AMMECR1 domain-containing protein [Nitrospinota bacterium]